ncbi:MAG TPA: SPASM domain-containing protein [Acetobacteraceae bacterium]|nr:SPASM domain-containing protein [Acetobacteraceae bacterium]
MPTLEITTKLGCSLACRFCPQDRLVKSYPRGADRMLTFGGFKRVMGKVPSHVRVDFSGMAEPWLNPRATEMVVHAFESGRKVAIYTTLQGMSPDDAAMLIEQFVDRISPETPWVIHLPDRDGAMTGWKSSAAYLATLARFVALQRQRAPAGLSFLTMNPNGAIADPLLPLLGEALPAFRAITRAENLNRDDFSPGELLRQVHHDGALLCASTPFFDHNTMLPNGDVVLCCMDYAQEHVIGNLFHQTYAELFAGAGMAAIRTRAMGIDGGNLICRRCHNATCLDQEGGTHWRPRHDAVWTRRTAPPAEAPRPAARRRPGLRDLMRRLAGL